MSGLLSHQDRLDVVSDNISNANTVAFKRGRVAFSEMLGQQLIGVSRMQGGGNVNPAFVGNGVNVGSIDKTWNQGSLEFTDIRTDIAINGDGFFISKQNGRNVLSRAGNFSFDQNGRLVTSGGLPVMGYGVDGNGDIDASRLTEMRLDPDAKDSPKFTENATISGNLSADAVDGDEVKISTTVFDEQGKEHNAVITYTKTANANEWNYDISYGGSESPAPFTSTTGTLQFDTEGSVTSGGSATLNWDASAVSGGGSSVTVDMTALNQYSGSSTAIVEDQDGRAPGTLVGYNFDTKGKLVLNFSNGEQRVVGQLALGEVNNPNGLEQLGGNLYGVTGESGELITGRAGQEINASMVSGALEQSNVDLATEFTDMITSQRGYQASARVITTSDEILQETLQLKR